PRVVSRSLKEGLRQHGSSPDAVDVATLEQILKGHVYRQLQVTMPVTEAKSTVAGIVERLRELGDVKGSAGVSGLEAQRERLERLQQALKPYNLYFEWPEVQKLRAQLQLLEADHEAARGSGAQRGRLGRLQQARRPASRCVECPEARRPRARLQLLGADHEAARASGALLADAGAQLEVVAQKLEDQLVLQAREIGELTEA